MPSYEQTHLMATHHSLIARRRFGPVGWDLTMAAFLLLRRSSAGSGP